MRTRIALLLLTVLMAGCAAMSTLTDIGSQIAVSGGYIDEGQAESLRRSSQALEKAFTDITPEQEYYIGRAVGAGIVSTYRPWAHTEANRYVNLVGLALAKVSDLPETFGGYHVLILDSDEINAFAAPGGLIFVTRGLLRCCPDEDAVAAVLAHEIGHVQARHGLQAIKKSRLTEALTVLGAESAKQFGGAELAQLTAAFEGSIGDITATLVNNGYSRSFEYEADRIAVTLLSRLGYDPAAIVVMLEQMQQRLGRDRRGFAHTHPAPRDRIAELVEAQPRLRAAHRPAALRQARFGQALARI